MTQIYFHCRGVKTVSVFFSIETQMVLFWFDTISPFLSKKEAGPVAAGLWGDNRGSKCQNRAEVEDLIVELERSNAASVTVTEKLNFLFSCLLAATLVTYAASFRLWLNENRNMGQSEEETSQEESRRLNIQNTLNWNSPIKKLWITLRTWKQRIKNSFYLLSQISLNKFDNQLEILMSWRKLQNKMNKRGKTHMQLSRKWRFILCPI